MQAAREIFAERGADAPLSAIAKRAGVGQGSLYRHFPDRTALVAAVFDENIAELEGMLLSNDAAGIFALFDRAAEQAISSVALYESVIVHRRGTALAHLETRLRNLAQTLLERDRDRGAVAASIDVDDVLLGVAMIAAVVTAAPNQTQADVQARVRRLFATAFGAADERL